MGWKGHFGTSSPSHAYGRCKYILANGTYGFLFHLSNFSFGYVRACDYRFWKLWQPLLTVYFTVKYLPVLKMEYYVYLSNGNFRIIWQIFDGYIAVKFYFHCCALVKVNSLAYYKITVSYKLYNFSKNFHNRVLRTIELWIIYNILNYIAHIILAIKYDLWIDVDGMF